MTKRIKNKIENKIKKLQKEITEMEEKLEYEDSFDLSEEGDLQSYHNYQCLAYSRLPQEIKFLKSLLKGS